VNEKNPAHCFDVTEASDDSLFPTDCPDRCDIKISRVLLGYRAELIRGAFSVCVYQPLGVWAYRERLRATPERVARRERQELLWSCSECHRRGITVRGWCGCDVRDYMGAEMTESAERCLIADIAAAAAGTAQQQQEQ
jgi:hypothetical protein